MLEFTESLCIYFISINSFCAVDYRRQRSNAIYIVNSERFSAELFCVTDMSIKMAIFPREWLAKYKGPINLSISPRQQ